MLLAFSQPVNCVFWPMETLNWLVAASKLHKHRGTYYTTEWPYCPFAILWFRLLQSVCTRAKMNNLINVVNTLLQCCAAPCQQCCAAPCQQLLSRTIVHSCSQLFTFSNHDCSIIVDNHQQAFSVNYWRFLLQQRCNNYCPLSTSNY